MAKEQHGWYSPEEKMHYVEEYFNSGLSLTKFVSVKNTTLPFRSITTVKKIKALD